MANTITAYQKALLISYGSVEPQPDLEDTGFISGSTAGPGAGGRSVFIAAGDRRVRLSVKPGGTLRLYRDGDFIDVLKEDTVLARGKLEPAFCHCPNQAYVTVSERCSFHCRFCPVPALNGPVKTIDQIVNLIDRVYLSGDLQAISLTGGVETSVQVEEDRMVAIVKELQKIYDVPIGVSIYPQEGSSDALYDAGVDEVKYNIETPDERLFSDLCPELNKKQIISELKTAASLFGKDRVSSNMIVGLGESDRAIISEVRNLAELGVISVLRPITINPAARQLTHAARPSAERLLSLATESKRIFLDNGLSPLRAQTMCLPCTGCDLTPFRDL